MSSALDVIAELWSEASLHFGSHKEGWESISELVETFKMPCMTVRSYCQGWQT